MIRRVTVVVGMVVVVAFVAAAMSVDLQAQRGAGAARGRPATAGNPAARAPQHPATPKADHPTRESHPGKPTGTTGRPVIGDQLARNTNLTNRLHGLFPAGTDLQKASAGFKNLGQFVAAAHVSHNLDIPFDSLKARMTGTDAMSLGQAIHELKPAADAKREEQKAQRTANGEIEESGKY